MERLAKLESCLRLAYEGGAEAQPRGTALAQPCGIALASYFPRAPTRGRRRSELELDLIFPRAARERIGPEAERVIEAVKDPSLWRVCKDGRSMVPTATREGLAGGGRALRPRAG